MSAGDCTFAIEVRHAGGGLAGISDASAASCVEDAWLRSVQAGRSPNDGELPALRVVPTWHDAQRPAVTGLSVSLKGEPPRQYSRGVFWPQAHALIRQLREQGRVAAGQKVEWSVVAREGEAEPERAVCARRAPFPLEPAALPHAAKGSYEICVDAHTLRGLRDRIRRTGTVEGAELLVGHLLHDAEREALELRVVGAIPLESGRGGSSNMHFSFDPGATLAARRRALERDDGAVPCGWHHNHNPCPGCWENPDCRVDWVFFSGDDQEVQSTLFASPHMVALVGGKLGDLPASRPGFRLYGWRDGLVVERPFRVIGCAAETWDSGQQTFREGAASTTPKREETP